MKRSSYTNFAVLFLGLVPTLSACAIKDIAGDADAGAGGAPAPGAGGGTAFVNYKVGGEEPGVGGVGPSNAGQTTATGGAEPGTGGSSAAPTTLPTWPTPDGCVAGSENSQFAGAWEGYIQGTPIGDEPSSIRLNIMGANSSGLCGTVTIGTHTTPVTLPPATDAAAVYPPPSIAPTNCYRPGNNHPLDHILGLAYTILDGKTDAQRATFAISYTELYKSWCPLQTSYPSDLPPGYDCLPSTGNSTNNGKCYITAFNGDLQEVSCTQMCLCTTLDICACNSLRCVAKPDTSETLFDLLFNGDQAMGTFGSSNVVFNRVARSCVASGQACNADADCCSQLCVMNGDGGAACQ